MNELKLTGANIFGLSIINFEEIEFRQNAGKITPVRVYNTFNNSIKTSSIKFYSYYATKEVGWFMY